VQEAKEEVAHSCGTFTLAQLLSARHSRLSGRERHQAAARNSQEAINPDTVAPE
jgi:hypothetical protein